jgi:hypothetical protein
MICRSFNHFSKKHATGFVPLPYQPENNGIPVKTPPTGFVQTFLDGIARDWSTGLFRAALGKRA